MNGTVPDGVYSLDDLCSSDSIVFKTIIRDYDRESERIRLMVLGNPSIIENNKGE